MLAYAKCNFKSRKLKQEEINNKIYEHLKIIIHFSSNIFLVIHQMLNIQYCMFMTEFKKISLIIKPRHLKNVNNNDNLLLISTTA